MQNVLRSSLPRNRGVMDLRLRGRFFSTTTATATRGGLQFGKPKLAKVLSHHPSELSQAVDRCVERLTAKIPSPDFLVATVNCLHPVGPRELLDLELLPESLPPLLREKLIGATCPIQPPKTSYTQRNPNQGFVVGMLAGYMPRNPSAATAAAPVQIFSSEDGNLPELDRVPELLQHKSNFLIFGTPHQTGGVELSDRLQNLFCPTEAADRSRMIQADPSTGLDMAFLNIPSHGPENYARLYPNEAPEILFPELIRPPGASPASQHLYSSSSSAAAAAAAAAGDFSFESLKLFKSRGTFLLPAAGLPTTVEHEDLPYALYFQDQVFKNWSSRRFVSSGPDQSVGLALPTSLDQFSKVLRSLFLQSHLRHTVHLNPPLATWFFKRDLGLSKALRPQDDGSPPLTTADTTPTDSSSSSTGHGSGSEASASDTAMSDTGEAIPTQAPSQQQNEQEDTGRLPIVFTHLPVFPGMPFVWDVESPEVRKLILNLAQLNSQGQTPGGETPRALRLGIVNSSAGLGVEVQIEYISLNSASSQLVVAGHGLRVIQADLNPPPFTVSGSRLSRTVLPVTFTDPHALDQYGPPAAAAADAAAGGSRGPMVLTREKQEIYNWLRGQVQELLTGDTLRRVFFGFAPGEAMVFPESEDDSLSSSPSSSSPSSSSSSSAAAAAAAAARYHHLGEDFDSEDFQSELDDMEDMEEEDSEFSEFDADETDSDTGGEPLVRPGYGMADHEDLASLGKLIDINDPRTLCYLIAAMLPRYVFASELHPSSGSRSGEESILSMSREADFSRLYVMPTSQLLPFVQRKVLQAFQLSSYSTSVLPSEDWYQDTYLQSFPQEQRAEVEALIARATEASAAEEQEFQLQEKETEINDRLASLVAEEFASTTSRPLTTSSRRPASGFRTVNAGSLASEASRQHFITQLFQVLNQLDAQDNPDRDEMEEEDLKTVLPVMQLAHTPGIGTSLADVVPHNLLHVLNRATQLHGAANLVKRFHPPPGAGGKKDGDPMSASKAAGTHP